MTKEQTNWEKEFEEIFVRDSNFYNPADEIRTRWLVPYVDTSAEQLKEFISKLISQEKEKWNESVIKMLEDTDVQMSVNGDVSQDEKAMAKFLYKAHINHIKKKLQKDVSTTSINTDSAKS